MDKKNHVSYTRGDDSQYNSSDTHDNDGVIESALVDNSKTYGGKDALDVSTTNISLYENLRWNPMSTSQKSKLVWETRKWIKNTTGYKIPGNNSTWYRTKIPNSFKNVGRVANAVAVGAIVYDVVDSKQIKASHILDAAVTGIGFIPGWGWAVGGIYLGADMITKGVTGESIGQHLDNAIEENFNMDNGALVDFSK